MHNYSKIKEHWCSYAASIMMWKVINEIFRICFSQMLDRTFERLLLGGGGNQNVEHEFVLWWFWKRVSLREIFWKGFQVASNVFFLPFPDYFYMQLSAFAGSEILFLWLLVYWGSLIWLFWEILWYWQRQIFLPMWLFTKYSGVMYSLKISICNNGHYAG